jgi:serine/threonine protein kinase
VWRVQDLLLDQKVALKVSIGDLTIETVALRRLPKDRYFSIFDYVQDDYFSAYAYSMELLDKPWMTIDYYEKKHLRPSFANPTKSADAVRMVILIAIDILTSLGALHGKKYGKKGNRAVHADIKPQNLYINRVRANLATKQELGSISPFTKIGDLGLTIYSGLTASGGTPGYEPPEQECRKPLSPAADLYAIAQTIGYMITGKPFSLDALKHVKRIEAELSKIIPCAYITKYLASIISKMTKKSPVSRGTCDEAVDFLTKVIPTDDDWKIIRLFMARGSQGLTINEAADCLFDEFKVAKGWKKKSPDRIESLKP